MRKVLAPLAFALMSLPAAAQSLNVDFEPARNPYGPLTVYDAGPAIDPGFWNSVSSTTVRSLRDANGVVTDVGLTATHGGYFREAALVSSEGEIDRVFNDYWQGATDPSGHGYASWEFRGLIPGDYEITTICGSPTHGDGLLVNVEGSHGGGHHVEAIAGPYMTAVNFTEHRKTVTDGRIEVFVSNGGSVPSEPVISAIQIVREQDSSELLCTGDGAVATCPCWNLGDTGRGCQNSASTGGAFLQVSGTTNPDTMVLHSTRELPSAFTMFFQGTVVDPPSPFGDGLRCIGGPLLRLYSTSASAGIASAPLPGEPSITARAAALGAPIAPGDRRYYQAVYRDPSAEFCASPSGSTFNASQMVKIVW